MNQMHIILFPIFFIFAVYNVNKNLQIIQNKSKAKRLFNLLGAEKPGLRIKIKKVHPDSTHITFHFL